MKTLLKYALSKVYIRCFAIIFLVIGTVLVQSLIFPTDSYADIGDERLVRVGIFQNEPIVFQDKNGLPRGLYVDILNEIAKKENWELQYVPGTWAKCIERLKTGDIDIMTSISYSQKRADFVDWSRESIWTFWGVVFVHPKSSIDEVLSLNGRKVAVLKNGINAINFFKLSQEMGITCDFLEVTTYSAAFEAVESGEADAAVVNSVYGAMHSTEYNVSQTSIVFSPINAYFAVPKSKNEDLTAAIDRYINEWKQQENSVYNRSMNKWLSSKIDVTPIIPAWIVTSLFILVGLSLFLIFWAKLLQRMVRLKTVELQQSEAKLNALFTSLTEMVVMHELVLNKAGNAIDYRIIDCNKVFTGFTGIIKEDAIGKLASEVYQTNPPPYLEKYAKVALGGDPHEFTTFYPSLDKHFMISVVSPQAGKFATITTDISDMMQVQEMIIAKNKEMENYLYVASHDLRTPLVNIQGFSQRLKKQADSIKTLFADKRLEPETLHQLATITDENIPKTLNFVLSNIEKMDTLINGLLRLSRTGTVEMNIQKIDMKELFAKILQSLDFQIKEAQCKINIDSLPECYGDAALLDQLFANIISNALKYSDSERALEITVNAKNIHNRVVYNIRDTGKGIAQKHLEKIWDIFYRIDPRSGNSGEGLGLSLVKRIAEKHKGKAWAESEENKGSAFHIELHNSSFTEL
jgi:signal transduction histidine kinase/ABC-type amino acid transport substrate-binding protein